MTFFARALKCPFNGAAGRAGSRATLPAPSPCWANHNDPSPATERLRKVRRVTWCNVSRWMSWSRFMRGKKNLENRKAGRGTSFRFHFLLSGVPDSLLGQRGVEVEQGVGDER
jgi:hypothetical protein